VRRPHDLPGLRFLGSRSLGAMGLIAVAGLGAGIGLDRDDQHWEPVWPGDPGQVALHIRLGLERPALLEDAAVTVDSRNH
jgi:hypothetical protein